MLFCSSINVTLFGVLMHSFEKQATSQENHLSVAHSMYSLLSFPPLSTFLHCPFFLSSLTSIQFLSFLSLLFFTSCSFFMRSICFSTLTPCLFVNCSLTHLLIHSVSLFYCLTDYHNFWLQYISHNLTTQLSQTLSSILLQCSLTGSLHRHGEEVQELQGLLASSTMVNRARD